MIVLEFVGRDAESDALLFVDEDGREYAAALTENLTAAVIRGVTLETVEDEPVRRITPREIQALLREGVSPAQIAAQTNTDVERIRRFEGPVRAEILRAIDLALSSPVGSDTDGPSLGELVVDRLAERGVDTDQLSWQAARRGTSAWEVSVVFVEDEVEKSATWSLSDLTNTAAAADDAARGLTESARKPEPVRALFAPVTSATIEPVGDPGDFLLDRQEQLLKRLSAARGRRQPVMMGFENDEALLDTVPLVPAPRPDNSASLPAEHHAEGTTAGAPSPGPSQDGSEPSEPSEVQEQVGLTPEPIADLHLPPAKSAEPSKKRGRTPMPSWDEIVFGSRGE